MTPPDLISLVLFPLALGLLGFIEPCSIGSSHLLEVRRRVRQSLSAWKRAPLKRAAVCPHIEGQAHPARAPRDNGR